MSYRASSIKSIQRGTITLNTVTSNTGTITSVDTNYSIVELLGIKNTGTNAEIDKFAVQLVLTNATTITATMTTANAAPSIAAYQVIEYYPFVMRQNVQRGVITTAGGRTATITAVGSKAFLAPSGFLTTGDPMQDNTIGCYLELTNSTTVTLIEGLANGFGASWQVVDPR